MAAIGWDGSTRHAELVRRAFGQDELVPPGVILELERLEWALLKQEFHFVEPVPLISAGGAGFRSQLQVLCPSSSLMVLKRILNRDAAFNFRVAIASTNVVGWTFADRMLAVDTRLGTNVQVPGPEFYVRNNAAAIGTTYFNLPPNTPFEDVKLGGLLVLKPGLSLIFDTGTDNQQFSAGAWWVFTRPFEREEATA